MLSFIARWIKLNILGFICTILSLLLRGKDFSLHFQAGIATTSRFYLPQKYQKKEKTRYCFLRSYERVLNG